MNTVPLPQPDAPAAARPIARVLIVDDEVDLCSALAAAVRGWGCEALKAHTAKEARALLEHSPDLVILDLCLPDGSGIDLAREASRRHPAPLIVAMSGLATTSEAFELGRAGVRGYLVKPVTASEVRAAVEAARVEPPPECEPFVSAHLGWTGVRELQRNVRQVAIDEALARAGGRVSSAAKLLRVSRQAIQQILRRDEGGEAAGDESE